MLRQNNMTGKTKNRLLIILNVDGLSLIIKNLKLRSYLKNEIQPYVDYKEHLKLTGTGVLKIKGWKQIYYANVNKKPWIAMLLLGNEGLR